MKVLIFLITCISYLFIASAVYQWGALEYKFLGGDGSSYGKGKRLNWWDHPHTYSNLPNISVLRWVIPISWPVCLPVLIFHHVNAYFTNYIYQRIQISKQPQPKIITETKKYELGSWNKD